MNTTGILKKLVITSVLLAVVALLIPQRLLVHATANVSYGIANNIVITDTGVRTGDIVSSLGTGGFVLSRIPYDRYMVGVVADSPAILIHLGGTQGKYPVITSGNAIVNVSLENGPIKEGDPITTSSVRGVGMKSNKSGYVLGNATESFSAEEGLETKAINVALNIHYQTSEETVQSKLTDIATLSSIALADEPLTVFKYVVAGIVIILSFVLGFLTFGRIAARGVDALGRNPLAIKRIGFGIGLNVIITVSIIASGIGISVFILRI